MKAKEYLEQIKPYIGNEGFELNLVIIAKSIIMEGSELIKKRKCESKESLKAVFNECNLKFIALCNLIKKETNLYNLDNDLFFSIFKQIMPDVYELIY